MCLKLRMHTLKTNYSFANCTPGLTDNNLSCLSYLDCFLPWLISPCNVCKALLGVQSSPQPCIEGLSPASLSLCSNAGLLQCVGHLRVQRNLASPGRKAEAYIRNKRKHQNDRLNSWGPGQQQSSLTLNILLLLIVVIIVLCEFE